MNGSNGPSGFNFTFTFGNGQALPGAVAWTLLGGMSPQPMCACGCGATTVTRAGDGRFWTKDCLDKENRKRATASAQSWLRAAFCAVPREQRARLYRKLAEVFHPDAGGDPQLMVALNAVREWSLAQ